MRVCLCVRVLVCSFVYLFVCLSDGSSFGCVFVFVCVCVFAVCLFARLLV